jgi:4-amino-4-deoxy-L-arabinose transferase-like glycosyltransferase
MPKKNKLLSFFKKHYLLILLTASGAFLRLYNLRSTLNFLGDEGRDAIIVSNFLKNFDIMLVGPTASVGKIQLGPLYYYFMAPWLKLFNFDPVGPAFGVALIGIVTIPVLHFVTKKMFNPITANIVTLMYTFSSIVIHHTRGSWNPNPMPLIAILLIYSLFMTYKHKKYKYLIWSLTLFAIGLQLHYMILLLLPFLLLIYLLTFFQAKNKKFFIKNLILGILVFIIFALPLVIFDFRHNFLNWQGFLEFFQKGHHSPQIWYQPIIDIKGRVITVIGNLLGFEGNSELRNPLAKILALAFLGLAFLKRKNKSYQLIALYFIFSILGLSIYSGDVFYHYLGFLFPLPFIILALILDFFWQFKNKFLNIFISVIILGNIFYYFSNYDFLQPAVARVDVVKQVATFIGDDVKNDSYNIVLLDETNDYRAMNYRYFLQDFNNIPDGISQFSDVKFLYIITQYSDLKDAELEIWEIETFVGSDYKEARLLPATENRIINSWKFENGPWVFKLKKQYE